MEDVWIGGKLKKMGLRGPATYARWRACWRVFRHTMMALDACPTEPLYAYEKLISTLESKHPDRCGISATADEMNRMEEWDEYRTYIEEKVAGDHPPTNKKERYPS